MGNFGASEQTEKKKKVPGAYVSEWLSVYVCVLVNPIQTVRTNGGLTITGEPVSSDLRIPQRSS